MKTLTLTEVETFPNGYENQKLPCVFVPESGGTPYVRTSFTVRDGVAWFNAEDWVYLNTVTVYTFEKKMPVVVVIRRTVHVKGRGDVHLAYGEDNPGVILPGLMGQIIRIHSCIYRVISVECISKNGIVQNDVGLIIRPESKSETNSENAS